LRGRYETYTIDRQWCCLIRQVAAPRNLWEYLTVDMKATVCDTEMRNIEKRDLLQTLQDKQTSSQQVCISVSTQGGPKRWDNFIWSLSCKWICM